MPIQGAEQVYDEGSENQHESEPMNLGNLIPTIEGVLSRFEGLEEAPIAPETISQHLPDFRAAEIRRLVNAVNDLLVSEMSLSAFAAGHYRSIPFHPPNVSENDFITDLFRHWEWYHKAVIEEFKQVGWFIRQMPDRNTYAGMLRSYHAFALDPAALPEAEAEEKDKR